MNGNEHDRRSPHATARRRSGARVDLKPFRGCSQGPLAWLLQLVTRAMRWQACLLSGVRAALDAAGPSCLDAPGHCDRHDRCLSRVFARSRELAALLSCSADETRRDPTERSARSGEGRTRFLALWGMIFGAGSAIGSVLISSLFSLLPRCAG